MKNKVLFFDLDDTLYPSTSGLWDAIRDRIDRFMSEKMHIPPDEISNLRQHLFRTYGTTLRGLQAMFNINPQVYLDYVHDLPLNDYISPNPDDRKALISLPQRKFIFTNSDIHHALRVLDVLNLSDCFDGIIDILKIMPNCKPQLESFKIALAAAGNPDPHSCVLIDDMLWNLSAAHEIGFRTIHIANSASGTDGADAHITTLVELPDILPSLFISQT